MYSADLVSFFFFSSRRRHTRWPRDWSSDVCSSDLFAWEGRYNPPWIRDIAREIEADEQELRAIGRKLVRQGRLFQVVRDLFYHREHVIDLALLLKELSAESGWRVHTFSDLINVW